MKLVHTLAVALALAALAPACDKKESAKKSVAPASTTTAAVAPTPPPPPSPAEAATPGLGASGELRLPLAERKVGVRWTKTDDSTSHMDVELPGKKLALDSKRRHVDQIEIVEVAPDGTVMKVKAAYPERTDTETQDGKARDKTNPLAGKSYVVWSRDGELVATHADDSPVTAEELAELVDDLDEVGKPRVMDRIMSERSWKLGEPYAFTADQLAALKAVKGEKAPRQVALTLTLTGIDGGRATFAMKTSLAVAAKAEMQMDLSGNVIIDVATGRPLVVTLSGPVTGSGKGLTINGTISGNVTYEYTGP